MRNINGIVFHNIINNVFLDVKGLHESEQIQVNCPRCQERNGLREPDGKYNLEINTNKKVFRCWKCDEPRFSGSLGKLIRLYGSSIDYSLYKTYAGSVQYFEYDEDDEDDEIIVTLPKETILFSKMDSNNPLHFNAYNYLINERKLTREIILKYRIGFCVEGKYANRIIIPSFDDNGNINYFVARTYLSEVKQKYDNPKFNKSKIIFNEGYINWDSTIYLVEGVFEMFRFPVNTIPMLGKIISDKLFFKLKEMLPEIVIILDPDAYSNSVELFFTLKNLYNGFEDKIRIVKLPNNDDLDEIRRYYGINEVIKHLFDARKLIVDDYFERKLYKTYDAGRRYNTNKRNDRWEKNIRKSFIR